MKDIYRKPSGICLACGKPTKLLCHEGCGAKMAEILHKKPTRNRKKIPNYGATYRWPK